MANFIEYAYKAQEELSAELQKVADQKARLDEQATLQAATVIELEKRQAKIAEEERAIDLKKEELSLWNGKKMREEQVEAMYGEAMRKDTEASKKLKEASEKLAETRYNLADLEKREIALSEREKTYREELKKEMMDNFLRVK